MVKCSPSLVCNKFWPLCWWILLLTRVRTMLTIVDLLLPKYQRQIKRCFQCVTIAWHARANGVVSTLIDDGKFWPIRLRHSCVLLKKLPNWRLLCFSYENDANVHKIDKRRYHWRTYDPLVREVWSLFWRLRGRNRKRVCFAKSTKPDCKMSLCLL